MSDTKKEKTEGCKEGKWVKVMGWRVWVFISSYSMLHVCEV